MKISKEVKVGVLGIVAAVILYFGFNFLKGVEFFSPVKNYYMVYDNINALTVSNPVMVNGYTVGRVSKIEMLTEGDKNPLKVTIEVEDNIPVGENTEAVLMASSLFGGMMIQLKIGQNKTQLPSGTKLKSRMEKSLAEELQGRVQPVLGTVDSTLIKFRDFIDAEDQKSFKAMVKNFEKTSFNISKMVEESRLSTGQMANNLIELTASLKQTEKSLKPLLDKADIFADSLNTLHLSATIQNTENALKNLDSILSKVNSDQCTIGALINDKALLDSLNQSMNNINSMLQHFDEHPKHFIAPLGSAPNKDSDHWQKYHGSYKEYKKSH